MNITFKTNINKIIALLLCINFLLLLMGCTYQAIKDWNTFEIEGYGSVKVPENWSRSVVDGYIYFSTEENGESKCVLAQYSSDGNVNKHFDEIEEMIWIRDINFSNSTGVIKEKVCYKDGTTAEMFTLYFTGPNNYESTEFLCLDSSISEETLENIAKSFVMVK